MTRSEREIASWVKDGEKLSKREPTAFQAALRNASWNDLTLRTPPPIDSNQLPLVGVEPPPKAKIGKDKGDNGRRSIGSPFSYSGRVVAVGPGRFILAAVELRDTETTVYGDTTRILEWLPYVIVNCAATVSTNGARGKRLDCMSPGDLLVCRDQNEVAQHLASRQAKEDKRAR